MASVVDIACRVVDSRTGLPAIGMRAILRSTSHRTESNENKFWGRTSTDGQVDRWYFTSDVNFTLLQFFDTIIGSEESTWQIGFDAANYFGRENKCWLAIDIHIHIKKREPHQAILVVGPDAYRFYLRVGYALFSEPPTCNYRKKAKQLRKPFSIDQEKILMKYRTEDGYHKHKSYREIANELGEDVSIRKVQRWFATRRLKLQRHSNEQSRQVPEDVTYTLFDNDLPPPEASYLNVENDQSSSAQQAVMQHVSETPKFQIQKDLNVENSRSISNPHGLVEGSIAEQPLRRSARLSQY
ncbi:hypothetical protein F5884DRAFT_148825 [Xylogone sp. PMI_703]|nr:hypothetical protein F5884DRAFT_148825 [Xylogone sp. PMI_703]